MFDFNIFFMFSLFVVEDLWRNCSVSASSPGIISQEGNLRQVKFIQIKEGFLLGGKLHGMDSSTKFFLTNDLDFSFYENKNSAVSCTYAWRSSPHITHDTKKFVFKESCLCVFHKKVIPMLQHNSEVRIAAADEAAQRCLRVYRLEY